MLPCIRRYLSRWIQHQASRPVTIHTARSISLPFRSLACFSTASHVLRKKPKNPLESVFDLKGPPLDATLIDVRKTAPAREPPIWDRQHGYLEMHKVVEGRLNALPRASLQIQSSLLPQERELALAAIKSPSYRTARALVPSIARKRTARQNYAAAAARKKEFLVQKNWTILLDLLSSIPIYSPAPTDNSLSLSNKFIHYYTGTTAPNSWIHYAGSGVRVQTFPRAATSSSRQTTVLVEGSQLAMDMVMDDLGTQQAEYQARPNLPVTHRTPNHQDLAVQDVTSVGSFTRFVAQITDRNKQLTGSVQKDATTPWAVSIVQILVELFENTNFSKYASTHALNIALRFIGQYSNMQPYANALLEHAKSLDLVLNTATYNTLLLSALRTSRMIATQTLLREMRHFNVPADSQTWGMLFSASPSSVRSHIAEEMSQRAIQITKSTSAAIHKVALRDVFPKAKLSSDAIDDLLHQLDTIFGPHWMTLRTYNELLRLSVSLLRTSRRSIDSACIKNLKDIPKKRAIYISAATKFYYLALAKYQGVDESIIASLVEYLLSTTRLSDRVISLFFMTAWNSNFYNVCGVIWTYAATRGQITYQMQNTITKNLLRNARTDSRSRSRAILGAKVISGIQSWQPYQVEELKRLFPKLVEHFSGVENPSLWLVGYTPDDGTRDEQISLAYLTINQDLNAWKGYSGVTNQELVAWLVQAYDKDKEWIRDGKLDTKVEHQAELMLECQKVLLRELEPGETNWAVVDMLRRKHIVADALREGSAIADWSALNRTVATDENGEVDSQVVSTPVKKMDRERCWWDY